MNTFLFFLALLVVIGMPILGICLAMRVYGGEQGERYQKRRMQGPFVPLSAAEIAEIAEDEEKRKKRKEASPPA